MKISLDLIDPNPKQPRREFDPEELERLAASMQDHGQLQPVVVEPFGDRYLLIAGERRTRAARMNGWTEIEAVLSTPMSNPDRERLVLALTENLQRADMNPLEKANAFQDLLGQGYTRSEIAGMINLSPAQVGQYLNLLQMPPEIQAYVAGGKIPFESNGMNALRSIEDPAQQVQVARVAAAQKMSGPGIARMIKRMSMGKQSRVEKPEKISKAQALEAGNGRWNALAQLGARPKEKRLCLAAETTCKECPLYPIASSINCRDCPAVALLRHLTAEGA